MRFEAEILQECKGGNRIPRKWGAAVGAALEWLRGRGYLDMNGITPRGHDWLRSQINGDNK